ncbi:small subunit ribosomal protein S1 [Fistulifera solaris]|uniref:Small subunit ribosomal protein S1 n=1 Tax=Fistulifera solaris TaxID=1519565 RepID=A0A1Z5JJF9_FISSO|nr:small subunit ribosomal protein S1 [Fistulifera solaris]|eukprot:GAX13928.1 small subunit ribosomal protein S1 [Fistulifera solaris]
MAPSTLRTLQATDADISVLWTDDDEEDEPAQVQPVEEKIKSSRWDSLNPRVKERLVKAGQERAIVNKKKRESDQTKKRRMMMFVKEQQREKKRAAKVQRPLPFDDRTPLTALIPGMEVTGIVISLTKFGAYIDIGTECDGLLHVSQISRDVFVEHPKQILTPGDEVMVRVRSINAEKKKLHLSMLPEDILREETSDDFAKNRIALVDMQVDDELWGEFKRITDFGAYVEVGAEVDAFLHFMDHPAFGWSKGSHPTEFMKVGDRVRIWVSDLDFEQRRIKVTANRPPYLPGPRRELS